MSLAAEASKTAIEIYQPVIVGLGAVVLGLLANACLEWWKQRLLRNEDIKKLRIAIYFEALSILSVFSNSVEKLENENFEDDDFVVVKSSKFLSEFDPRDAGLLTINEVRAISKLCSYLDGIFAFVDDAELPGTRGRLRFKGDRTDNIKVMVRSTLKATENVISSLELPASEMEMTMTRNEVKSNGE